MATKNFTVATVSSSELDFTLNNETVSVSIGGGNQTKYLASEGYRFDYTEADTAVKFSTEIGGEYAFSGAANTSVVTFDASGAKDLIKLDATGLTGLTTIKTGAGNDSIAAKNNESIIKTGEGNDIVTFSGDAIATVASVTLGDGKDTLVVSGGTVELKDYSFAEGDEISISNIGFSDHANNINVAADGKFSVGIATASVTGSLKSEGNVAEMKINGNHFAFATGNVSDYVAKDKVLFQVVANDVDVLNFTSGKKDTSVLATGLAKDATLNFVSDHGNDSVAVVDTTKINYAITKNSGYDTFTGKAFTTDDTLMIKDGVAASLKINAGSTILVYGNTSVNGVLDATNGGSFKVQNAGSDESYLMSYVDGTNHIAAFSTDAKFYLAAEKTNAVVDASDLTDANINMNGDAVTYAAFSDGFTKIKTAQSGYVVGRNNVATSIDASAGVGRLDIYGGAKGNDSINLTNNNSTDVIYYSLGDGNDTVTGFDATSDVVFFYNANANYKALSEVVKFDAAGTTVTFDKKTNALTLQGVKAGDTLVFADQNMAEAMKVAIGKDNAVEFATDTKVYTNAETLKVNTGNTGDVIGVNLTAQSDDYGYYSTDIVNIDASGSNATTYLVGANKAGAKVIGGTGTNYIYGGGNKNQELFGNAAAVDVIYFGTGDGKDNVTSISADDGVLLYNVADINSVKVTADSSQTVVSLGSDKLTLNGLTETDLATFTFADQSGALYNYNTTDKKFVKKA